MFRRRLSTEKHWVSTCDRVDWKLIEKEKDMHNGWPVWLQQELRSDHAGETGAVHIYKGAISAMKFRGWSSNFIKQTLGINVGCPYHNLELQPAYSFAQEHMLTEAAHLEAMERLVPSAEQSKLISLWKVAGFCLGVLPVLASPYSPVVFFCTINAVETFVEEHYNGQIRPLERGLLPKSVESDLSTEIAAGPYPELLKLLRCCNEDEIHHKEEAKYMASAEGLVYGEGKKRGSDIWLSETGEKAMKIWASIVGRGSEFAASAAKRF